MSNIDKRSVQAVADLKAGYTLGHADVAILNELARIALASLEAEPVGYFGRFDADDEDLIDQCSPNIIGAFPLYAAPPAPANAEPVAWLWSHRKHPSEVTLVRPEDDEKAEGAHWSGWSCQALYAEPQAPVSVPDEDLLQMAASAIDDLLSNKDRSGAGMWVDIPAKLRRAAMLQGADGNSPDGWVACSERMPEVGVKVLCFPVNDEPIHATYNGQLWLQDISWSTSDEPIDNVISCNVFHWMPLPAAPQQEVKNG